MCSVAIKKNKKKTIQKFLPVLKKLYFAIHVISIIHGVIFWGKIYQKTK